MRRWTASDQLLGLANIPGAVTIPLLLMLLAGVGMCLLHKKHDFAGKVLLFSLVANILSFAVGLALSPILLVSF